jgi:hypothetical protein
VGDSGGVRVTDYVEQRRGDRRRLGQFQRSPFGQHLGERLAVDELHNDVQEAVGLTGVEHGDGAGMPQPGGRTRLAHETVAAHWRSRVDRDGT